MALDINSAKNMQQIHSFFCEMKLLSDYYVFTFKRVLKGLAVND